jgi:hypothetical protein
MFKLIGLITRIGAVIGAYKTIRGVIRGNNARTAARAPLRRPY